MLYGFRRIVPIFENGRKEARRLRENRLSQAANFVQNILNIQHVDSKARSHRSHSRVRIDRHEVSLNAKENNHSDMLEHRKEMVMAAGSMSQLLGYPKSVGKIYGYLFFSLEPLSLGDISQELGISKGSASSGVRQLIKWNVVRQTWGVQGDRKEYFEAIWEVRALFKSGFVDFVKPRVVSSKRRIDEIQRALREDFEGGKIGEEEYRQSQARFENLKKIQARMERILPLIEALAQ